MDNARQVWYELKHAEICDKFELCKIPRCPESKFLLQHAAKCTKEKCKYLFCGCAKFHLAKPEGDPNYAGKDYFADINLLVLRKIVDFMTKSSQFHVQFVNRRVYDFFQSPKCVNGVFEKITFEQLRITQLVDGSTMFHFAFNLWQGDGVFHIYKKNGEEARFQYFERRMDEAMEYISTNHGVVEDHMCCDLRPVKLSEEFYDGLKFALNQYSFEKLFVGSVLMDDQFLDFFSSGKNGISFDATSTENVERANTKPWEAGCRRIF